MIKNPPHTKHININKQAVASTKRLFNNPKKYLDRGDALYQAGNIEKAVLFYKKAVESDPIFIQGWINLSEAYQKQGLISKAETSVKHAIELNPRISHTYLILGKIFTKRGRLKEAAEVLETSIELSPNFIEAYYTLIEVLMKLKDVKKALQVIDNCLKLEPCDTHPMPDARNTKTLSAEDHSPHNAGPLRDKIRKKNELAEKHHDLGLYYRTMGEEKKMKASFFKFCEISGDKDRDARHFRAYCALGRYNDAFEAAEKIMSSDSVAIDELCDPFVGSLSEKFIKEQLVLIKKLKTPPGLKIWKIFYRTSFDHAMSLEELKTRSARFTGKYAWMKYNLAIRELFCGNYAGSLSCLKLIGKIRPKDWLLGCTMAEVLLCIGKKREAFQLFDRVYRSESAKRSSVKAWKGECYLFDGQYAKAINELNAAVNRANDIAYAWRGAAYFKSGMYKKALNDLHKAVKLAPYDLEARTWRGEVYRVLGDFKLALKDLNFVIEKNPDHFWAYFNRALIRYRTGNYRGMANDFDKIDADFINVIKKRSGIKLSDKPAPEDIFVILQKGLELAKGNRRHERYMLKIAFPEYHVPEK